MAFVGAGKKKFEAILQEERLDEPEINNTSAGVSAMQHFSGWTKNDVNGLVWISDPNVAYVPGTITSIKGNIATVSTKTDKYEVDFEAPIKQGQAKSLEQSEDDPRRLLPRIISESVDDMDDLTSLHEASILNNLHNRFLLDRIYTNSGPILIAMNPFCWLHLYGEDAMWQYMQAGSKRAARSSLPPHCFAEAQGAFDALHSDDGKDQAIVICGESGSGKTETTKLILSHLAFVSDKSIKKENANGLSPNKIRGSRDDIHGQPHEVTVADQIVESGPLLEAFGNAKTTRNFNSSRFGKFITLKFDVSPKNMSGGPGTSKGKIIGAHVSSMLLESSRVVSHALKERNYHIFYQMLSCDEDMLSAYGLNALQGKESSDFKYLQATAPPSSKKNQHHAEFHDEEDQHDDDGDDADDFPHTLDAMSAVDINNARKAASLRIIAAILLLGNVQFDAVDGDSGEEAQISKQSLGLIDTVTALLGIKEECTASTGSVNSLGKALCERVMHLPGGEVVVGVNTVPQAEESRDALAKAIYCKLFDWIVDKVNHAIEGPQQQPLVRKNSLSTSGGGTRKSTAVSNVDSHGKRIGSIGTVGVLDIFGFEDMQTNGLEQLLINTANETLQGVFNAAIFAAEEAVHKEEGVAWAEGAVNLPNNTECVSLLEGKPLGILRLLDSTCSLGSAAKDGKALVASFNQSHASGVVIGSRGRTLSKDLAGGRRGASSPVLPGSPASAQVPVHAESSYCPCGFATAWRKRNGDRTTDENFAILHFAGPVIYTVEGWVHRNRDELHQHISELLTETSNKGATGNAVASDPQVSRNKSVAEMKYDTNMLLSELFPTVVEVNEHEKHGKTTVGGKFLQQLANLRQVLTSGEARFVRCVKTNNNHLPRRVDRLSVLNQLICGGVMAALEVRRAGFPNRIPYADFVNEYRIFLSPKEVTPCVDDEEKAVEIMLCQRTQDALGGRQQVLKSFRPGKTKLFLAASAVYTLANARSQMLVPAARVLQRWWQNLQGDFQNRRWRRCVMEGRRLKDKAAFENISNHDAIRKAQKHFEVKIQAAASLMAKVLALGGFGVVNVPVPAAMLEAEEAIISFENVIDEAVNEKANALKARAEQLEILDGLDSRLAAVTTQAKRLYNSYDKSAMASVCRSAARAMQAARLIFHVPDPGLDALLPNNEQEGNFASLRHGELYKTRSKAHRQSSAQEKLPATTPRGARRLERLTKRAVATATETISEHLSPRASPRLSPRKNKHFEFPDQLPPASSGSALAGEEEMGEGSLVMDGGMEGLMKISAAKTAAKIWREKTKQRQVEKDAMKNDGGNLLLEAAEEKVKAAEMMCARCQGANKLMQKVVDEVGPQLEDMLLKLENEFKPAVRNMFGSRGFDAKYVESKLKEAEHAIDEAKHSVTKLGPHAFKAKCEETKAVMLHVSEEIWKAEKKAQASASIDDAIQRLDACRLKAASSDMGMVSALDESPRLRKLIEAAENEARLPDLNGSSDAVIEDWAHSLETQVKACELLLAEELKKLKSDRLSRFDNIKKAFEKPSSSSSAPPKRPTRRASSYMSPRASDENHGTDFPSELSPTSPKGSPPPRNDRSISPRLSTGTRSISLNFSTHEARELARELTGSIRDVHKSPSVERAPGETKFDSLERTSSASRSANSDIDQSEPISPQSSTSPGKFGHRSINFVRKESTALFGGGLPKETEQIKTPERGKESGEAEAKLTSERKKKLEAKLENKRSASMSREDVGGSLARSEAKLSMERGMARTGQSKRSPSTSTLDSRSSTLERDTERDSSRIEEKIAQEVAKAISDEKLKALAKEQQFESKLTAAKAQADQWRSKYDSVEKEYRIKCQNAEASADELRLKVEVMEKELKAKGKNADKSADQWRSKLELVERDLKSKCQQAEENVAKWKALCESKENDWKGQVRKAEAQNEEWRLKYQHAEQEIQSMSKKTDEDVELVLNKYEKMERELLLRIKNAEESAQHWKTSFEQATHHEENDVEGSEKLRSTFEALAKDLRAKANIAEESVKQWREKFEHMEEEMSQKCRSAEASTQLWCMKHNALEIKCRDLETTANEYKHRFEITEKKLYETMRELADEKDKATSQPKELSKKPSWMAKGFPTDQSSTDTTSPLRRAGSARNMSPSPREKLAARITSDKDNEEADREKVTAEKSNMASSAVTKISKFSQHMKDAERGKKNETPIADRIAKWKQKAGGSIYGTGEDKSELENEGVRSVRAESPMTKKIEEWKRKAAANNSSQEEASGDPHVDRAGARAPLRKFNSMRASSAPARKKNEDATHGDNNQKDGGQVEEANPEASPPKTLRRASSVTSRRRSRSSTLIAQRLATWSDRDKSGNTTSKPVGMPRQPSPATARTPAVPRPPSPSRRALATHQAGLASMAPGILRSSSPRSSGRSTSPRSTGVTASSSRFRSQQPSFSSAPPGPKWGSVTTAPMPPRPTSMMKDDEQPPPPPPPPPKSNEVTPRSAPKSSTSSRDSLNSSLSTAPIRPSSPVFLKGTSVISPIKRLSLKEESSPTKVSPQKKPLSPLSIQSHDSILPPRTRGMKLSSLNNGKEASSVKTLLSSSGIALSPPSTPNFAASTIISDNLLSFGGDEVDRSPKTTGEHSEEEIKYMLDKLRIIAEKGHARDQFDLGFLLFEGKDGVKKDLKEASKWFRKAADQSMAEAQFNLGLMYDEGIGLPQSDTKAVAWYLYAADQQFTPAQFNLGAMYHQGRGVPQSDVEAARWWKQAAQAGDIDAMAGLGSMFRMGKGVPQSYIEAARWYMKASEKNHPVASAYLGCLYRLGLGVTQSDSEAAKWFAKASKEGHPGASAVLALMYMDGKGVVRNGKLAWRSLTIASSAEHFGLNSLFYDNPEDMAKDLKKAKDLCTLAAVQGNEHAKVLLRTQFPADLMP